MWFNKIHNRIGNESKQPAGGNRGAPAGTTRGGTMRKKVYDTAMVLMFFAEMVLIALMFAVAAEPESLQSAYLYSTPDVSMARECYLVKTPNPNLKKKTSWHLQRIEEALSKNGKLLH